MNKRSQILSVLAFVIILGSGMVTQIVFTEKEERWQFLKPIEDTFVTPFDQEKSLLELRKEVTSTLAGAKEMNEQKRMETFDEALWLIKDMEQIWSEPNEYAVRDTLKIPKKWTEFKKTLMSGEQEEQIEATVPKVPNVSFWGNLFQNTLFNSSHLRAYESELEEGMVLAKTTRIPFQELLYRGVGRTVPKAVVGKNDFLFFRKGIDYLVKPPLKHSRNKYPALGETAYLEDPLKIILEVADDLSKRGIELLIVPIPGKASVYPEFLGGNHEVNRHTEVFIKKLVEHNIAVVDVYPEFFKNKGSNSLYLKHDTHFKTKALKILAKEISIWVKKRLEPKKDLLEYEGVGEWIKRSGDVAEMTQLNKEEFFLPEKVYVEKVFKITRDSLGREVKRKAYKDDYKNSRIKDFRANNSHDK